MAAISESDPLLDLNASGQMMSAPPISRFRHWCFSVSSGRENVYQAYLGHRKLVEAGPTHRNCPEGDVLVDSNTYRTEGCNALLKFAGFNESETKIIFRYLDLFFVWLVDDNVKLNAVKRSFPENKEKTDEEWVQILKKLEELSKGHSLKLREAIFDLRNKISEYILSGPSSDNYEALQVSKKSFESAVRRCLKSAATSELPVPKVPRVRITPIKWNEEKINISEEDSLDHMSKIKRIKHLWNQFKEKLRINKKLIIRSDIRT